jgi:hypothetical protein
VIARFCPGFHMPRALTPRFAPEHPGMRCARFDGESCAPVIRLSRAIATISGASDLGQTQHLASQWLSLPSGFPRVFADFGGTRVDSLWKLCAAARIDEQAPRPRQGATSAPSSHTSSARNHDFSRSDGLAFTLEV